MPPTQKSALFCTWTHRQSLPAALRSQLHDLDHFVRLLCSSATTNLFLVAPYLSSAGLEGLRAPIATSAQRGAWIRLVTGNLDHQNGANRRAVKTLVEGNEGALIHRRLRILTATEKLPALIHAKIILADQKQGYLGSANLSQSAMDRNFELGVALPPEQVRSLQSLLSFFEARGLITDSTERVWT
jgi:phosphatidylserine/phosphatidylglycerophosphate/cardiolipin synthase-like enzyme